MHAEQKANGLRELEMLPALISIHDVMPETLPNVQRCLDRCREFDHSTVYLLVVPGRSWHDTQIEQLQQWVSEGCLLVGHGWVHHADHIQGWRHRLHSVLISRDVAEHLCLDERAIVALMQRCRAWFAAHKLPVPEMYVPPAWAMGQVRRSHLRTTGFRYVETVRGIDDLTDRRLVSRPLIGYEADTRFRAVTLRLWNRANRLLPDSAGPPRLAIHPDDLDLKLSDELIKDLAQYTAVPLSNAFSPSTCLITAGRRPRIK